MRKLSGKISHWDRKRGKTLLARKLDVKVLLAAEFCLDEKQRSDYSSSLDPGNVVVIVGFLSFLPNLGVTVKKS